jgi:RimJ/RimL family protein N-acetyltransferase
MVRDDEFYRRRITQIQPQPHGPFAVIRKDSGALAGRAGFLQNSLVQAWELYLVLATSSSGLGFGREIATALLHLAFTTLRWEAVVGVVHPENQRSIRLLLKIGMHPWACIAVRDWTHRFYVYRVENGA